MIDGLFEQFIIRGSGYSQTDTLSEMILFHNNQKTIILNI